MHGGVGQGLRGRGHGVRLDLLDVGVQRHDLSLHRLLLLDTLTLRRKTHRKHTGTHTHTHTHTHTTYALTHFAQDIPFVCVCVCVCMPVYVCMHVYACACICVCVCVCVCVCARVTYRDGDVGGPLAWLPPPPPALQAHGDLFGPVLVQQGEALQQLLLQRHLLGFSRHRNPEPRMKQHKHNNTNTTTQTQLNTN